MSLKLRNFVNIVTTINKLNKEDNSIYLILHKSDLNIIQNNILLTYCKENDIESLNVKSKLFKKLVKNPLILNLFVGPTKIFLFKNVGSFLNFFKTVPFSNKIIPLAVYFNEQLYSYPVFINEVSKLPSESIVSLDMGRLFLINNLFLSPKVFIKGLTYNIHSFIKFLTYFKLNK